MSDGLIVRVGQHRWAFPTATIVASVLAACGAVYGLVQAERNALHAEDTRLSAELQKCQQALALEQVVLSDIRTQLARIDARVAEVQVTLMRGGRQ